MKVWNPKTLAYCECIEYRWIDALREKDKCVNAGANCFIETLIW